MTQPTPSPINTAPSRTAAPAIAAGIAAGVIIITALTLAFWQMDRSYWNDEAWGLDFSMRDSLGEVWRDAVAMQLPGAPGYLATLYAADQVREGRPWVFRIPTLLAGLLMLGAVVALARSWTRSAALACLPALFLLAIPFVQRYLGEAKQYMGDAGFTLALFAATRWWLATGRPAAAIMWALLAAVGVTMSFVFWFAVAAAGPVLFIGWLRRGDRRQVAAVIAAGVFTAIIAGIVYFTYARHVSAGQSAMGFWQSYYLPRDMGMFAKLWSDLAGFLTASWVPYEMPGSLLLAIALAGLIAWVWREPITGTCAVLMLLIVVIANLARLWPMVIRINLPVIVILHLAMAALPLVVVEVLIISRLGGDKISRLAAAAALLLAGATLYLSRDFEHEPSNVRALLEETARRSTAGDLVILDWAAKVNHRIDPAPIAGKIISVDWTSNEQSVDADYGSLIRAHGKATSYVLATLLNHERAPVFDQLGQSLADAGTFEKVWSDKSRRVEVALFRFEPK